MGVLGVDSGVLGVDSGVLGVDSGGLGGLRLGSDDWSDRGR